MDIEPSPAQLRQSRRDAVAVAARPQAGVLGRRHVFALGVTRYQIRAESRAGRWHLRGRQAIQVGPGDAAQAQWWVAVLEVSPAAALDGISALVAAGLRGISEDAIHVAVPKSADPRRCRGVVVHETRRYERASVLTDGIPRMAPATAAVHAVLWARTDREAAMILIAAAQQRLFTTAELAEAILKVRRDRRRRQLRDLFADIVGGIEALGEQDFARLCEARRFPQPTRQLRRRTPEGEVRFDAVWEKYGVTAEINGVQHRDPAAWVNDALKENVMRLDGHVVLRIPNVALRTRPKPFLDQLEQALRSGGWPGPENAQRPTERAL